MSNQQIITSRNNSVFSKIKEIWSYRELLWMLAWRDFRAKYAQSFLGVAWAVINPLMSVILLSFVFGVIAKVEVEGGVPYLLYTLSGMIGWTFFSSITSDAGRSIIGAQNMIKKIYFPRLIIPLSQIFTALIDFLVVFIVIILLMVYYSYFPSSTIFYLPLFIFFAVLFGISSGIWIAALTIRFRDFQHVVPFVLRLGMYVTPIAYPTSAVPEQYMTIYSLNPLVGIIEGMKWSLLGIGDFPVYFVNSCIVTVVLFLLGLYYFNRIERSIADII